MKRRTSGVVPCVITLNLEPDARVMPVDGTATWDGVDPLFALVEEWRRGTTERPVGWYWRCDPAIGVGMGDPGWALRRWRHAIDEARQRGDEVGVHPHFWRWSDTFHTFVSDAADPAWKVECVRVSADTFRAETGASARCIQLGDGYLDPTIAAALVANGIAVDLTLEPLGASRLRLVPNEWTTGPVPDRVGAPSVPYRPSRRDPLRAARMRPMRGLRVLPLTTTGVPVVLDRVIVDEVGSPANLGYDPYRFRPMVVSGFTRSAAAGAPYVHVSARSDIGTNAGLAAHVRDNLTWLAEGADGLFEPWGALRFMNPDAALEALGVSGGRGR